MVCYGIRYGKLRGLRQTADQQGVQWQAGRGKQVTLVLLVAVVGVVVAVVVWVVVAVVGRNTAA